ncbi:MAG: NADH-quinone oxidoreductase subunit C [Elusimicrobia bacterium]|nr:NADH-quinone oxidoreductase subunit C [Elusimicrobiota bacterium]
MTQDELFAALSAEFPAVARAEVPVKDHLTVRLPGPDVLLPLASWLKRRGFGLLDMLTATDFSGPTDMKGFVGGGNFNVFLPDGAAPQVAPVAAPGYRYRPVLDLLWSFVSIADKARVIVRLEVPRENASAPSLSGLFKAADWQERETFDLLGVRYEGHPNLTKILTPDFLQGHPLRKDYVHVKDRFDD